MTSKRIGNVFLTRCLNVNNSSASLSLICFEICVSTYKTELVKQRVSCWA